MNWATPLAKWLCSISMKDSREPSRIWMGLVLRWAIYLSHRYQSWLLKEYCMLERSTITRQHSNSFTYLTYSLFNKNFKVCNCVGGKALEIWHLISKIVLEDWRTRYPSCLPRRIFLGKPRRLAVSSISSCSVELNNPLPRLFEASDFFHIWLCSFN